MANLNRSEYSVIKNLKNALATAIDNSVKAKDANDLELWGKWELRKDYLRSELAKFEKLSHGSSMPKRVFISYAYKTGFDYYQILKKELENRAFLVTDGYKNGSIILRNVLKELNTSTIYVGILTKQDKVFYSDSESFIPSVWTVEEKGMALGLKLPVVLILEKGIHRDYYAKTTAGFKHCFVNNIDQFRYEKVFDAVETIIDKYTDLGSKQKNEDRFYDI